MTMIKVTLCLAVMLLLQPSLGESKEESGGTRQKRYAGEWWGKFRMTIYRNPWVIVMLILAGLAICTCVCNCCRCFSCLCRCRIPDDDAEAGSQSDDMKLEQVTAEDSNKHDDNKKNAKESNAHTAVEGATDPLLPKANLST